MPVFMKKGDCEVKNVDSSVANKFNWSWLDKQINVSGLEDLGISSTLLSSCIKKQNKPGLAWCSLCSGDIKYGSEGVKALRKHVLSKNHITN